MDSFKVMAIMSLQDLISSPLQNIGKQLNNTNSEANTLTDKIKNLGKSFAGLAATATVVIGAFGAMTAKAAEFEQGVANMSTLFGDVNVDMKHLETSVLNLSSSTGVAASELNDALTESLSSGVAATRDMSEALSFVEKSAMLAKSGFTSVATVVNATTSVLNAYRMDISKTDSVHKVLQQTQNLGKTTVEELGKSLAQVTPIASSMGVSFEQVGAALSTLTNAGLGTAESTTQLKSLFSELGKNGTSGQKALMEAVKGTELAGLSFQEMMKKGVSLSDVLNLMANYADNSGQKLLDLFSSIEAGSAALSLSGLNTEFYNDALKEMGTTYDVVGDAYSKVTNTMTGAMDKLRESKNALFITIGKLFIPIVVKVSNILSSFTQILMSLSNSPVGAFILKLVASFSALVVAVGAIAGVFIFFKAVIAPIIMVFSSLSVGISILMKLFLLLKVALIPLISIFSAMTAPILVLIGIVVALYFTFKNNLFGISDIAKNIVTNIGSAFDWIINKIKNVIDFFSNIDLFSSGKKLIDTFVTGITSVINKPKEILENGLTALRRLLPFSDAKEGPLSTLTLSGQRMITTLAEGVELASPNLHKTTSEALSNSINIDNIPDFKINPINSNTNNNTTNKSNLNTIYNIRIDNISLTNVKDGNSFIKELQNLALSLGVV